MQACSRSSAAPGAVATWLPCAASSVQYGWVCVVMGREHEPWPRSRQVKVFSLRQAPRYARMTSMQEAVVPVTVKLPKAAAKKMKEMAKRRRAKLQTLYAEAVEAWLAAEGKS